MKLKVLQNNLKRGLNIIERVSIKSLTLPVLNNILIRAEKNFLNLITTDLEIGIKWWNLAKIEEEGKVLIPTRIFSSFISFLKEGPVELKSDNQDLIVESENFKTKIRGFNPEEFPIIPEIKEGEEIFVNSLPFCRGLSQIISIPILSSARPEISGVYFSFQKDLVTIVATDSFRLGEKKLFFKTPLKLQQDYSLILPQKSVREIMNIFIEEKSDLKIKFTPNQVLFESQMEETDHPKVQLISRLIEGEYPDYQAIFPKKSETQIVLDKEEFSNQLKTASLFASRLNEVKLTLNSKKGEIGISSQNPELGEYHSVLKGEITGKEIEVSFNFRFLIDGLLNLTSNRERGQKIIFELNGEEGPAILKPVDDPSYIYLVMPIKSS